MTCLPITRDTSLSVETLMSTERTADRCFVATHLLGCDRQWPNQAMQPTADRCTVYTDNMTTDHELHSRSPAVANFVLVRW